MKKLFAVLLISFVLAGCKTTYDVTLSNGQKFTGVSKPYLNKKTGKYHFKMMDGREASIHPANIRLIEPSGEEYEFRGTQSPKK